MRIFKWLTASLSVLFILSLILIYSTRNEIIKYIATPLSSDYVTNLTIGEVDFDIGDARLVVTDISMTTMNNPSLSIQLDELDIDFRWHSIYQPVIIENIEIHIEGLKVDQDQQHQLLLAQLIEFRLNQIEDIISFESVVAENVYLSTKLAKDSNQPPEIISLELAEVNSEKLNITPKEMGTEIATSHIQFKQWAAKRNPIDAENYQLLGSSSFTSTDFSVIFSEQSLSVSFAEFKLEDFTTFASIPADLDNTRAYKTDIELTDVIVLNASFTLNNTSHKTDQGNGVYIERITWSNGNADAVLDADGEFKSNTKDLQVTQGNTANPADGKASQEVLEAKESTIIQAEQSASASESDEISDTASTSIQVKSIESSSPFNITIEDNVYGKTSHKASLDSISVGDVALGKTGFSTNNVTANLTYKDQPIKILLNNTEGKNSYDFDVTIANFSTTNLNPYSEYLDGLFFEQGVLSANFKGNTDFRKINSNLSVALQNIKLLSGKDIPIRSKGGKNLPLGLAIDFLQDSDNNLSLDFPINGDISSPNIDLDDITGRAFEQALLKAATSYLENTLYPFNLVWSAGDYIAEKLNQAELAPIYLTTEYTEDSHKALTQLSEKLKILTEKDKDAEIAICTDGTTPKVTEQQFKDLKGLSYGEILQRQLGKRDINPKQTQLCQLAKSEYQSQPNLHPLIIKIKF